eukprot:9482712-Pyramimonas_sp.AAC.1
MLFTVVGAGRSIGGASSVLPNRNLQSRAENTATDKLSETVENYSQTMATFASDVALMRLNSTARPCSRRSLT